MKAQMPEDQKRQKSNYIIENDGDLDDLRHEVEFLLARFLRVEGGQSMPYGDRSSPLARLSPSCPAPRVRCGAELIRADSRAEECPLR
jgi:hypothetical protein